MAAFALTLVPAAAFAATGEADAGSSSFEVTQSGDELTVTFTVNDDSNNSVTSTDTGLQNVTINVYNAAGRAVNGLSVIDGNKTTVGQTGTPLDLSGVSYKTVPNGGLFKLTVPANGSYTVSVNASDYSVDGNAAVEALKVTDKTDTSQKVYVSGDASTKASQLNAIIDGEPSQDITVDPDSDPVTLSYDIYDASGDTISTDTLSNVYIWAEDANGHLDDAIAFDNGTATIGDGTGNDYIYSVTGVKNDATVKANFVRPGTYYVYTGVATSVQAGTDADTAFNGTIDLIGDPIKVTINARNYDVASFDLTSTSGVTAGEKANEFKWNISNDGVAPNGTKVYTVTGQAFQSNGSVAPYVTLNLDVNKSGLSFEKDQVSTDKNGTFKFKFTVTKANIYKITISEDGNDGTSAELTVDKDDVVATNITTIKDNGVMLAGNDSKYVNDVYGNAQTPMSDAVQFEVTDSNGNPVVNQTLDPNDYLINLTVPTGSTLTASQLSLVWDKDNEVYTLQYNKTGRDIAKDLIPGEYSVRIAFKNSTNAATATFTLAKFGEVQSLAFNGSDEVVLGDAVTGSVCYVDEQGIKVPADNALVTASGDALRSVENGDTLPKFSFQTKLHTIDNEAYYGTTITLTAFDSDIPSLIQKEVTVVAEDTDYSLAFDSTSGPADENNRVAVSVVDSEGDVVKVNGEMTAYVVNSSNEEAKVDVTPTNVANGKGALTIYSDQETELDIAVVVVDASNEVIYAGNLDYTVGAEDVNADTSVVMTIGSSDYVVNNDIVTGDAAPYVDSNWRTMVPFRVLGETFGATVNWNEDDQTVTYTLGDTEIVMTIGEDTYTVNGEEKTMDTAPVIQNDRTMVPVRFVAEALGYTVTPLQDANGLTASVVFQK